MSSFHKPKVYRSTNGCCICKVKTSSTPFSDSRKYENYFMECFQLTNKRHGDICSVCTLSVKRYKRRPVGSDRRWGHLKAADSNSDSENKYPNKHRKRQGDRTYEPAFKVVVGSEEEFSSSDNEASDEDYTPAVSKRKAYVPVKRSEQPSDSIIQLDSDIWKKENVCCGSIWRSQSNHVILHSEYFKLCPVHLKNLKTSKDSDPAERKLFSDNSSDSGYESSVTHLLHKKPGLLNDLKPPSALAKNQEPDENASKGAISKKPNNEKVDVQTIV